MKKVCKLLGLLIFLSLVGCAQDSGKTQSTFKVGLRNIAAETTLSSFPGGLMLFGKSGDKSFGRTLTSDTLDEVVPNGVWDFYVIGWDRASSDDMTGKVYCASQKGVELLGEAATIDLMATNKGCLDSSFGKTIEASGLVEFPKVDLQNCSPVGFSAASSANFSCDYDPDPAAGAEILRNKGAALAFKFVARSFNVVGSEVRPVDGALFHSACVRTKTTAMTGGLASQVLNDAAAKLNLPLGAPGPFRFYLRTYLGSDNCEDATGFVDHSLKREANSSVALKQIFATDTNHLFVATRHIDVCARTTNSVSINGTSFPFKGGAGTTGAPFIICNGKDLNAIGEKGPGSHANKSFILAKNIDMNPLTAALHGGGNTDAPAHSKDGENYYPIGVLYSANGGFNTVNPYSGVFDGNGKTIKGLRLNKDEDTLNYPYMGFIPLLDGVNGGKLLNTKFIRPEVSGLGNVGLVGKAENGAVIKNIEVLHGGFEARGDFLGGVLGYGPSVTIENVSLAKTSVRSREGHYVGGVVGKISSGGVTKASFNGRIEAADGGFQTNYVGGISGYNGSTIGISQAASSGTIMSYGTYVGGIAGDTIGPVSDVYSNMFIKNHIGNSNDAWTGGILGSSSANLSNVYFTGQVDCRNCASRGEVAGSYTGASATNIYIHSNSVIDASVTYTGPGGFIIESDLLGNINLAGGAWSPALNGRYPKLAFEKNNICDEAVGVKSIADQIASGRGTSEAPVSLCSVTAFKDFLTSRSPGKYYSLENSFSVGELTTEAGSELNSNFDGKGNNILNITLSSYGGIDVGLFGSVSASGTVKNVNLLGAKSNLTATISGYTGFLAGANYGTIERARVVGDLSLNSLERAGMLVGINEGVISRSSASGHISGFKEIGGLASFNKGEIIYSSSRTDISINADGAEKVGGIVAVNGSSGTIDQSESHGSVNDENSVLTGTIGLFIGLNSGSVSNSYVDEGMILFNGIGVANVGGFVGFNEGAIQTSYSLGELLLRDGGFNNTIGGFVGNGVVDLSNAFYFHPMEDLPILSSSEVSSISCDPVSNVLSLVGSMGDLTGDYRDGDYLFIDDGRWVLQVETPTVGDVFSLPASTFNNDYEVASCDDFTNDQYVDFTAFKKASETERAPASLLAGLGDHSQLGNINTYLNKSWDIAQFNGDGSGHNEDLLVKYHMARLNGENVEPPVPWEIDEEGAPRLLGLKD